LSLSPSLLKAIESIINPQGYELVDSAIEKRGRRKAVVLFIDHIGEGTITVDDCGKVSRLVQDVLADNITDDYMLEVSSPGVNRPISTPEHFKKYRGEMAKVKITDPIEGDEATTYTGEIIAANDETFSLKLADRELPVDIQYSNIHRAKLKRI